MRFFARRLLGKAEEIGDEVAGAASLVHDLAQQGVLLFAESCSWPRVVRSKLMMAFRGWLISWAAPATRLPSEASFSFCTSWSEALLALVGAARLASSDIRVWSCKYWRRNTKLQYQHRGQDGENAENARGAGEPVEQTVQRPSTGKERIASMAMRGTTCFQRGWRLNLMASGPSRGRTARPRRPGNGAIRGNVIKAARVVSAIRLRRDREAGVDGVERRMPRG